MYFLVKDYWGCAAGWGHIDYNGVTFLVELLEWNRKFSGLLGLENSGKQGFKNRKICS